MNEDELKIVNRRCTPAFGLRGGQQSSDGTYDHNRRTTDRQRHSLKPLKASCQVVVGRRWSSLVIVVVIVVVVVGRRRSSSVACRLSSVVFFICGQRSRGVVTRVDVRNQHSVFAKILRRDGRVIAYEAAERL